MKELKEAIESKRLAVEICQHIPEKVAKLEEEIAILEEALAVLEAYPER